MPNLHTLKAFLLFTCKPAYAEDGINSTGNYIDYDCGIFKFCFIIMENQSLRMKVFSCFRCLFDECHPSIFLL